MNSARRCIVSGLVQGVAFRASARSQARAYGVFGFARNLPDGRVEVHVEGESSAVDALCDWLWDGPPAAEVTGVECKPVAAAGYAEFLAE